MFENVNVRATAGVLAVAVLVGGAGVSFPVLQMALCLCGLLALAYFVTEPGSIGQRQAKVLLYLGSAAIVLGLAQLVPLPPWLWSKLPGRELVVRLDLLTVERLWRPLSLDVEGTIRSLLILIPAAAVFVGTLRCGWNDRLQLIRVVIGGAILSAALGLIQLATHGSATPYASAHAGFPIGFFVNRNHQAALLLAAMPLVGAWAATVSARNARNGPMRAAAGLAIALFTVVIITTTSRMALLLLPPILAFTLAIMFARQSAVRALFKASIGIAGVALVVWMAGGLDNNLSRFSALGDARVDYWADMKWALAHYGLAGTGYGSFAAVQKTAESLSNVTPAILNHAHNDYIELLLEGGLPAVLLVLAFFVALGAMLGTLARADAPGEKTAVRFASAVGVCAILIFSLVDYPLRMPAIASVFAVLLGVLVPDAADSRKARSLPVDRRSDSFVGSGRRLIALAALGLIAIFTVQAGVSATLLNQGAPEYAARWAPWSSEAWSRTATDSLFLRRDPAIARSESLRALRLSPLDARAIRNLGLIQEIRGDQVGSIAAFQLASTLGWRDLVTNLWSISAAVAGGDAAKAVERAEALYRQHQFDPTVTAQLIASPVGPTAIGQLATDLGSNPDWRWGFLRSGGRAPEFALPAFARLFLQVNRGKSPVRMIEAQPLLDRLNTPELFAWRRALWESLHARALISNGGFEQTSDYRGQDLPVDWDISDEDIPSLYVASLVGGNQGNALGIRNGQPNSPLIAQTLILRPGAYELSFRIRAEGGMTRPLRWALRCLDTGADTNFDLFPPVGSQWETMRLRLTVPDRDCHQQRLALEVLTPHNASEMWVDDVSLKQLGLTQR